MRSFVQAFSTFVTNIQSKIYYMVRLTLSGILIFVISIVNGQEFPTSAIFAHNDYDQPAPFHVAYALQVGFIEADVFLDNGDLMVAHHRNEIQKGRTLDELYLKLLQKKISVNNGNAYPDASRTLTLMIDLKTEGVPTLNAVVKRFQKYPGLINCKTLQIAISGNVPDPTLWKNYPDFIHFDGRPGIDYSKEQLDRISLISASFGSYSHWNGKGVLTKSDREKIVSVITEVHSKGKRIRFWGIPDFKNSWLMLMDLQADVIGTDHVPELVAFAKSLANSTFHNPDVHVAYRPQYKYAKGAPPKNVILMIGDGTGLTQLYSGYTANRGSLSIFNINDIGFSVTTSSDSYITDSAAGATAMSTGKKTNNRFIGMDSLGNSLPLITEKLSAKGVKTAIISSGDITDATPASFYAHQPERSLNENIANDFLKSKVDILIGGGVAAFKSRTDKRNLLQLIEASGYSVSEDFGALETMKGDKFIILDDSAVVSKKAGRKDFLPKSVREVTSLLAKGDKPFFMMAEGAQIDYGGHENNMEYVVREVLDFDEAIGEAMKFVDVNGETLLIITADHETGGLSLLGGGISNGNVVGNFSTNDHTAVMVPVFSYGPGAENFRGVYQNTEINSKLLELLNVR